MHAAPGHVAYHGHGAGRHTAVPSCLPAPPHSDQYAEVSPVFKMRQRLGEPGSGSRGRGGGCPAEGESSWREGGEGGATPEGRRQRPQQQQQQAALPQREVFNVGRFCCARLALYHALVHWRRRLLARLKRECKAELRRRKVGQHGGGGGRWAGHSRPAACPALPCKRHAPHVPASTLPALTRP